MEEREEADGDGGRKGGGFSSIPPFPALNS